MWVPKAILLGQNGIVVKLNVVPSLRKCGSVLPLYIYSAVFNLLAPEFYI